MKYDIDKAIECVKEWAIHGFINLFADTGIMNHTKDTFSTHIYFNRIEGGTIVIIIIPAALFLTLHEIMHYQLVQFVIL